MKDCSSILTAVRLPVHECVERPILPCPACRKWTNDPFATVRTNRESFPGILSLPLESSFSQHS